MTSDENPYSVSAAVAESIPKAAPRSGVRSGQGMSSWDRIALLHRSTTYSTSVLAGVGFLGLGLPLPDWRWALAVIGAGILLEATLVYLIVTRWPIHVPRINRRTGELIKWGLITRGLFFLIAVALTLVLGGAFVIKALLAAGWEL